MSTVAIIISHDKIFNFEKYYNIIEKYNENKYHGYKYIDNNDYEYNGKKINEYIKYNYQFTAAELKNYIELLCYKLYSKNNIEIFNGVSIILSLVNKINFNIFDDNNKDFIFFIQKI